VREGPEPFQGRYQEASSNSQSTCLADEEAASTQSAEAAFGFSIW